MIRTLKNPYNEGVDWEDMTFQPWNMPSHSFRYKKSKPKTPKLSAMDANMTAEGKLWQQRAHEDIMMNFDGGLLNKFAYRDRVSQAIDTGTKEAYADLGGAREIRGADSAVKNWASQEIGRNKQRMLENMDFETDRLQEENWQYAASKGLDLAAGARGVAAQQLGAYNSMVSQINQTPTFMQQLSGGLGQAAGMMAYASNFNKQPPIQTQTIGTGVPQGLMSPIAGGISNTWMNTNAGVTQTPPPQSNFSWQSMSTR